MSYVDSLMSTGERIVLRERQHWFVMIWAARYAILALVLALVALVFGGSLDAGGGAGFLRTLLGWLTAILFVGGLAVLGWTALRYLNQEYVLTNRRIIQVEGVVNKRATDSSLEKINDAVLSQSVFGRLFGFGDLDVLTAAEAGIERFRMIRDPVTFKRAMLDAKHEYEVDMSGRGPLPGPPLRTTSTDTDGGRPSPVDDDTTTTPAPAARPAPPPPTPAPPPAASASPRMTSDEVTRTLANLADLRDRNAISAEEYEAKKADLLARL
ncbi:MAG: PH domain-containing protein [Chloroflexota bacterium]